jgi:3-methyladenine DNA glycosylase Tag
MKLTPFEKIRKLAEDRKGGKAGLEALLSHKPKTPRTLEKITDDRYLAMMTRCIFQAGFNWKVIENKWAGFEEAFYGFNPKGLVHLSPEQWEAYAEDKRVVRNWIKIRSVLDNAHFILQEAEHHGSFAKFFARWPVSDQVGLMQHMKKHGSRLGGNTATYFLRFMGKDSFILSQDVVARLKASGVEIQDKPSSLKDLKACQEAFNLWHEQSGLPYTHLSRIAGMSIGQNHPPH